MLEAGTLAGSVIGNGGATSSIGASTSAASNLVLAGGALSYTGATATSTNRNYTFGNATTAAGGGFDASGTNAAGTFTITGDMTAVNSGSGTQSLTLSGSNTGANTLSGNVVDSSGTARTAIAKTGAGTWVLAGTGNTFTGGVSVGSGTLRVGNANALNANAVTLTGGTLDLNANDVAIGNLSGTGGSISDAGAAGTTTLTINQAGTTSYAGTIANGTNRSVAVVKQGTGTLTLSGANTHTGGTSVTAGTLTVGNATALGANTATVSTSGTGQVNLNGTNVTVGGLSSTNSGGSGSITSSTAATLTVNATSDSTYGGTIGGSVGLAKTGTGTLTLSGSNSYQQGTSISAGSVKVASNTGLGTQGIAMSSGSLVLAPGTTVGNAITIGTPSAAGGTTRLLAWDFTGESSPATSLADVINGSLDASGQLSRGTGASASAASNSFRTTGFAGDGISTSNTDYFQFEVSASAGSTLSMRTIDARFAGTNTYAVSPGVSSQFAYSLDGTNFTLIGSPVVTVGTPATLPQIDLSGVTALQGLPASTTVTFRYYASGQTSTGGWGFNSPSIGSYGLDVGGSFFVPASGTGTLGTDESGTVTFASTATVLVNNTATLTAANVDSVANFNGVISGPGSITKTGDGTVVLAADNTYSGSTTVSAGTLQIGNGGTAGSVGTGAIAIAANASVVFNRSDNVTLDASKLSGAGSLTQNGANSGSTLTLTGNHTYAGTTTVSAGKLIVNGTLSSGAGDVAVSSGAAIGGSGTIGRDVSISGTLAPGNSAGTLTIAGDLALASSSTSAFELTYAPGEGLNQSSTTSNDDQVIGLTGLSLGGALSLTSLGGDFTAVPIGTSWTLFSASSAPAGAFASIGGITLGDGRSWGVEIVGNNVLLSVVPEPAVICGSLLVAVNLLRRRRVSI